MSSKSDLSQFHDQILECPLRDLVGGLVALLLLGQPSVWNMWTIFTILLPVFTASAALAQGTLIGPSISNGSFESGIAAPWNGIEVAQDMAFASQGDWFAVLQSATTPSARDVSFQFLSAYRSNGLTFIATFDARNATIGFDSVAAYFFARNADGSFVNAAAVAVKSPILSSTAWGSYQTQFVLPESWDGIGNISLGIEFSKSVATGGTYVGYLDNVTLLQVPEPSMSALFGLGALLMVGLHSRLLLEKRD